ncbi:hypothetical protein F5Y11DRAFT_315168 [Daldinia sp. FL1419]|nr:hypothetical protein F5Y11DRAFT_315168 [Daldinia sp. FL1419]
MEKRTYLESHSRPARLGERIDNLSHKLTILDRDAPTTTQGSPPVDKPEYGIRAGINFSKPRTVALSPVVKDMQDELPGSTYISIGGRGISIRPWMNLKRQLHSQEQVESPELRSVNLGGKDGEIELGNNRTSPRSETKRKTQGRETLPWRVGKPPARLMIYRENH